MSDRRGGSSRQASGWGERTGDRPGGATTRIVRVAGREFRVVLERGGGPAQLRVAGRDGTSTLEVTGWREGGLLLDGEPLEVRLVRAPDGSLSLAAGGESWPVEVLSEAEAALATAGGRSSNAAGRLAVRAPMPGRVVAVEVAEDQQVEAGAGLFVIEAMKMENEVRAPRPGIVRGIRVAPGVSVEGDQELCAIETGAS